MYKTADRIRATLSTEAVRLHGDFHAEALQIDDDSEDSDGRDQVHDVWETLTPKGFTESTALIVPGED